MITADNWVNIGTFLAGVGLIPEFMKVVKSPATAKELDKTMLIVRLLAFVLMSYGLVKKKRIEWGILILCIWLVVYYSLLLHANIAS